MATSQSAPAAVPDGDDCKELERIYVGGLDPSRGLTVELVSSRLRSVRGVEILSINDVAIATVEGTAVNARRDDASVYSAKNTVVDADGDLVDTRNFFFLEARAATKNSEAGNEASPHGGGASALDLLAKQYNSVKWKGCQLRVEAAKPHFLKRLEEERAAGRAEKDEEREKQRIQQRATTEDDKVGAGDAAIQNRRRLRIRKRFGEEAYHVDTRPHPLQLSSGRGWDEFASLHKRMQDKRTTQQRKLVERRKDERRIWASGGGKGKNVMGDSAAAATAKGGDDEGLRSLMFLNRAIHIRFSDEGGCLDGGRSEEEEGGGRGVDAETFNAKDLESATSSSVVSSSDSEESEDSSEQHLGRKEGTDTYVWSDEDDDDNLGDGNDTGAEGSSKGNDVGISFLPKSRSQYDSPNEDSITEHHKHNDGGKMKVDGLAYTKAAAIDEFSGGMDFTIDQDSPEEVLDDSMDESEGNASENDSGLRLEDDICSNIGVLSTIFPGAHFEKQPLVASINDHHADKDDNGSSDKSGNISNPLSTFGVGMIMQRYDPTKDLVMRNEKPSKKSDDEHEKSTHDSEVSEDEKKIEPPGEDDSASSEGSDGDISAADSMKRHPEERPSALSVREDKKSELASTNGDGVVPAKGIYEQDKLEDIFKQAREGDNKEPFTLAGLFQTGSNNRNKIEPEDHVYEQDKLETVFRKAREYEAGSVPMGNGFSFGFQAQLSDKTLSDGQSFGFYAGDSASGQNGSIANLSEAEETNGVEQPISHGGKDSAALMPIGDKDDVPQKKKGRMGIRFPGGDLDAYEDIFFGLNEGPQILNDLYGMKQDEQSQERWQKERLILTADWKRKQKSASSRNAKAHRS